jgi:hypothetical protein
MTDELDENFSFLLLSIRTLNAYWFCADNIDVFSETIGANKVFNKRQSLVYFINIAYKG